MVELWEAAVWGVALDAAAMTLERHEEKLTGLSNVCLPNAWQCAPSACPFAVGGDFWGGLKHTMETNA